jgi:hypothetical protein
VSNLEQTQSLPCAIIRLISIHSKARAARFCSQKRAAFLIPPVLRVHPRQRSAAFVAPKNIGSGGGVEDTGFATHHYD